MTAAAADYEPFTSGRWRGLSDPCLHEIVGGDDPLAALFIHPHQPVTNRPGSSVHRVDLPDRVVYVKQFKGLKNRPKGGKPSAWQRLKWRLGPSRALHTLHISRQMLDAGVAVPRVLLAARSVAGLDAADLLITERVEGQTLIRLLFDSDDARRRDLMLLAGRQAAQFHLAGFVHGDMLPMNMFVTPAGDRCVFFDNDRTVRATRGFERNLEQMLFRFCRRFGMKRTRAFMAGYDEVRRDAVDVAAGRWAKALRRVHQRLLVEQRKRLVP